MLKQASASLAPRIAYLGRWRLVVLSIGKAGREEPGGRKWVTGCSANSDSFR